MCRRKTPGERAHNNLTIEGESTTATRTTILVQPRYKGEEEFTMFFYESNHDGGAGFPK